MPKFDVDQLAIKPFPRLDVTEYQVRIKQEDVPDGIRLNKYSWYIVDFKQTKITPFSDISNALKGEGKNEDVTMLSNVILKSRSIFSGMLSILPEPSSLMFLHSEQEELFQK